MHDFMVWFVNFCVTPWLFGGGCIVGKEQAFFLMSKTWRKENKLEIEKNVVQSQKNIDNIVASNYINWEV